MFCAKCGNQVADGAAFCPNCGHPMPKLPPQPQPYQQTDPSQQAAPQQQPPYQPQQQTFPQQPQPQPYQQVPQPQPKRRRRWPIVVAISVVAVAAIAAVVVFVVLPRVLPKGIWVATKSVGVTKDEKGTRTDTVTNTIDDKGNTTAFTSDTVFSDGATSVVEGTNTFDDQDFAKSQNYKYSYDPKSSGGSSNQYEYGVDYQWTFGNDAKPTQVVQTITDANTTATFTKAFEYGSDGHVSKTVSTYESTDSQSETITEYEEHGLITKESIKGDNPQATVYQYEFDASNKPVAYTYVTTDTSTNKKTIEASATLKYDENGNMSTESIEYVIYPSDGSGPTKSTETKTYEYEYVENPTPWVAEIVRCSLYSFSSS